MTSNQDNAWGASSSSQSALNPNSSHDTPTPSQPGSNPNVAQPGIYPQLAYNTQGYLVVPGSAPQPQATVYPQLYPAQPVYTIASAPTAYQVPVAGQSGNNIVIQPNVLNQPVIGQVLTRTNAPPYDEREFTCMCGMHVHKAVMIIACISIALAVIELVFEIIATDIVRVYVTMWPAICSIIAYFLLFLGNRLKVEVLYYPYFIANVIAIIGNISLGIFILIVAIELTRLGANGGGYWDDEYYYVADREKLALWEGIVYTVGILYIISSAFQIYFYVIVVRGFRYLKNYVLNPSIPRGLYGPA